MVRRIIAMLFLSGLTLAAFQNCGAGLSSASSSSSAQTIVDPAPTASDQLKGIKSQADSVVSLTDLTKGAAVSDTLGAIENLLSEAEHIVCDSAEDQQEKDAIENLLAQDIAELKAHLPCEGTFTVTTAGGTPSTLNFTQGTSSSGVQITCENGQFQFTLQLPEVKVIAGFLGLSGTTAGPIGCSGTYTFANQTASLTGTCSDGLGNSYPISATPAP